MSKPSKKRRIGVRTKKAQKITTPTFTTMSPGQTKKAKRLITKKVLKSLGRQLRKIERNRPSVPERPGFHPHLALGDVYQGPPGLPEKWLNL